MKKLAGTILLGIAVIGLSGCTPPMPPELRISQEEQKFQCVDGQTSISYPESISDLAPDLADSLSSGCPGMSLVLAEKNKKPLIDISSGSGFSCPPFLSVPYAVDAATIIVNQPDISSLNLDLATASKIFDGTVSMWNAPEIAKLNPGSKLPNVAISVFTEVQSESLSALNSWAADSGSTFNGSLLKPTSKLTVKMADKIKENQIAILPYSINTVEGFTTATIVADPQHLKNLAPAESANIVAASTQWETITNKTSVTVALNSKLKPLAPQGTDRAPVPYEAIYPVNMALCGTDNLTTRAAARFLLRQDSQGTLGSGNLLGLPSAVRISAIALVSTGLPKVKIKAPAN